VPPIECDWNARLNPGVRRLDAVFPVELGYCSPHSYCEGARITLLHLCCTSSQHFTTTNSIKLRPSNFPSFENCHVVANKFHASSHCHVTSIWMSTAIAILQKQNQLSSMQKEDKLHLCKMSKSGLMHALQNVFFVFLILSLSNVCIRVQALSRHACNAWRLRMEAG